MLTSCQVLKKKTHADKDGLWQFCDKQGKDLGNNETLWKNARKRSDDKKISDKLLSRFQLQSSSCPRGGGKKRGSGNSAWKSMALFTENLIE